MLPATAAKGAPTFFQSLDEIGARTLPRRIKPHQKAGQERKPEREKKDRPVQRDRVLERNIVAGDFRNDRHDPKSEGQADRAGNHADGCTFEHEQPNDVAPLSSQSHSQRDLTPASAETDEQKICNIAAGN